MKIVNVAASPIAMQMIISMALIRRLHPVSTCPSMMSMMPLISGTPGTRNRGLVARAISEVHSQSNDDAAHIEAVKAVAITVM